MSDPGRFAVARHHPAGSPRRIALLAAGVLLTAAGCVTESVERSQPTVLMPNDGLSAARTSDAAAPSRPAPAGRDGAATPPPIPGFEDRGAIGRRVPVFTTAVRAEIQGRGAITFDEQTLPMVSPDGMRMAVPSGLPPEWPTLLADVDAPTPEGGVMIFDLSSPSAEPPRPAVAVRELVVLGRAVNDRGFLVESPRADGSRWIGLASWDTGAIEWVVTGGTGEVNAFATLGPDGWMAWCRRRAGSERFSLVVRDGDGVEQEIPSRTGSWLFPRFALDGTAGLFALMLRGDALDAVHLDPTAGAAMMATLRRAALVTDGADVSTAYQAMAGDAALVTDVPIGDPPPARLYFVHPAHARAAAWDPAGARPVLLDAGSFAASAESGDPAFCLVSTGEYLFRRALDEPRNRIRVVPGMHIARPTANPDRAYVLLQPSGSLLGVTLLRFEPLKPIIGG